MSKESAGMFSLKEKVIIVTGGTGVLGSSFVHAIAGQGVSLLSLHTVGLELQTQRLAILDVAGLRFLTDPTFDVPAEYPAGAVVLKKTAGPAIAADDVGLGTNRTRRGRD